MGIVGTVAADKQLLPSCAPAPAGCAGLLNASAAEPATPSATTGKSRTKYWRERDMLGAWALRSIRRESQLWEIVGLQAARRRTEVSQAGARTRRCSAGRANLVGALRRPPRTGDRRPPSRAWPPVLTHAPARRPNCRAAQRGIAAKEAISSCGKREVVARLLLGLQLVGALWGVGCFPDRPEGRLMTQREWTEHKDAAAQERLKVIGLS